MKNPLVFTRSLLGQSRSRRIKLIAWCFLVKAFLLMLILFAFYLFTFLAAQIYLLHLQNLKMFSIHTCEEKTWEKTNEVERKEPR